MGQLVNIEKLEDGKTKIVITRLPKTTNHYDILIRRGNICEFDKNTYSSEATCAKVYFDEDKQHRLHWHIALLQQEEFSEYMIVFNNTQWVRENINDIVNQLINQENNILVNRAVKNYVKDINCAVQNNNYTSLIKKMILDNASTFSDKDIQDLKDTLAEVEHQTIKQG